MDRKNLEGYGLHAGKWDYPKTPTWWAWRQRLAPGQYSSMTLNVLSLCYTACASTVLVQTSCRQQKYVDAIQDHSFVPNIALK